MDEEDPTSGTASPDEFDEPFETGRSDAELAAAEMQSELRRLEGEVETLRGDLDRFRSSVDARTVKRPALEAELRRYVRQRMRRSRARGWGPYLVLLYGTIMTLGAFYFLSGLWAILAMVVVWLSTLGLYVVMLGVGAIVGLLGLPSRGVDWIARRRSR